MSWRKREQTSKSQETRTYNEKHLAYGDRAIDPASGFFEMIIIIAALILTTLANKLAITFSGTIIRGDVKKQMRIFSAKDTRMNPLVLTDSNGKKCRGVVEIPVCRGYCQTSE
ncbi:hypothetical protein OSTOST_19587, partial [Ostertagia ostertagi]